MKQNTVEFQKGLSLNSFIQQFGTEERCAEALTRWRWPKGFVCPICGHTEHCVLHSRQLYQCNHCHHQTSLTADTIFANTKLPLTTWFQAMYFTTQQKSGVAALELKRHLGVSHPTAWSLKHKLMQVMKETDDRRPLSAEFCYRFNRRFKLEAMLPRLGRAAVRTPPMPMRLLRLAEAH